MFPIAFLFVGWQTLFLRRVVKSLPGETTVRIAEEGLQSDDGRVQALARWSGIEHIGQAKDHIVVVIGYAQGYAVPRAAFPGGGDPALQLMQRYCPQQEIEPAAAAVDKSNLLAKALGAIVSYSLPRDVDRIRLIFCEPLKLKREHAFLLPSYGRLPFVPRGEVFRVE